MRMGVAPAPTIRAADREAKTSPLPKVDPGFEATVFHKPGTMNKEPGSTNRIFGPLDTGFGLI